MRVAAGQEQYEQAPDRLLVRELKAGNKILVTTLRCARKTPKAALKALFKSRWHVELDLRNLKSTMGLEMLSCRTPAMAVKELWVYLLADNLIRMIMVQSAAMADCLPRELSFKHSLQLCKRSINPIYKSPAVFRMLRCPFSIGARHP
jgi:hypothetical protein